MTVHAMTVDDIETALDRRDLPTIEAAFRLLVGGADGDAVEQAEGPNDCAGLLDRVTAALEADRTPMPADLVEVLVRGAGGDAWLRNDHSYAAGARAVAADIRRWAQMVGAKPSSAEDGLSAADVASETDA